MALLHRHLVILSILGECFFCAMASLADPHADLMKYLKTNKTNFSPMIPPKINPNAEILIRMDSLLSRIALVDTAKQTVRISSLMQAQWDEERLVWNPLSFGNVSVISWDAAQIWHPIIMIYNGIGDNQILSLQAPVSLRSVTSNLTAVTALWRREFEFSCNFDVSRFPVDTHSCAIAFGFIDPDRGNALVRPVLNQYFPYNSLAVYENNSEWALLNFTSSAEPKKYPLIQGGGLAVIPTYELKLHICRLSNYYFVSIITPLILLTILQVLVYLVPLESGEKLGFGITIMLSYTVFLLLLDGILPKSQKLPVVAFFITAAMVLSTVSLLLTSLILRFHYTPQGIEMPACLRIVFVRFLGRILCVNGAAMVAPTISKDEETGVKKVDRGCQVWSDWVAAAQSIERLMVALGVVATGVILGVFIINPYLARGC